MFTEGDKKWEMICKCERHMVIIYGLYPFKAADELKTARLLAELNATLARGCLFLDKGRIVMRTSADLFDAYSAYETIARALEYNAQVVVSFWRRLLPKCEKFQTV